MNGRLRPPIIFRAANLNKEMRDRLTAIRDPQATDLREKLEASIDKTRRMCIDCLTQPKEFPKHRCSECALRKEPMDVQIQAAVIRAEKWKLAGSPKPARSELRNGDRKFCNGCGSMRMVDRDGKRFDQAPTGARCRPCLSLQTRSGVFGVDPTKLAALIALQDGRCACGRVQRRQSAAIDHDHRTGEVRGILCDVCNNIIIGGVQDDADRLIALACYLLDPPSRRVGIGEKPFTHRELGKLLLEKMMGYRKRMGYES